MATSDLIEMLKDPVAWKQDAETERRLCDQIVSQLDDSSSDVSSLAVKWYVCINSDNACHHTLSKEAFWCGSMPSYVTQDMCHRLAGTRISAAAAS